MDNTVWNPTIRYLSYTRVSFFSKERKYRRRGFDWMEFDDTIPELYTCFLFFLKKGNTGEGDSIGWNSTIRYLSYMRVSFFSKERKFRIQEKGIRLDG